MTPLLLTAAACLTLGIYVGWKWARTADTLSRLITPTDVPYDEDNLHRHHVCTEQTCDMPYDDDTEAAR